MTARRLICNHLHRNNATPWRNNHICSRCCCSFLKTIPIIDRRQLLTRSSAIADSATPSDRAMRLVSSNLDNYHATVQKLLIRQVLTKPMVRSWRFSWRQCVINKPTTVESCISPVYRRLAVAKFLKLHNVEIACATLNTPT